MNETTWLILFGILALSSFCVGIIFLVKYFKTKKLKFLWLGIGLTFIVPGLLLFFAYKLSYSSSYVTCYEPMVKNITENVTPLFLLYKKDLLKKTRTKVSDNVFGKISKK
jgi:hypothetical protein